MIDKPTLISNLMYFLLIIIFSLLGAIVKDTYNTLTEKDTKVKISRILVSTIVSSIILFSLSDTILSKITPKQFILPCFIGGMIGFELLGKIKDLGFWIKIYKKNKDVVDTIAKKEIDDLLKEHDKK